MLARYHSGLTQKIIASHRMNSASSRSHCLLTIYIDRHMSTSDDDTVNGRITLVDLAGSERVAKTGAAGMLRYRRAPDPTDTCYRYNFNRINRHQQKPVHATESYPWSG